MVSLESGRLGRCGSPKKVATERDVRCALIRQLKGGSLHFMSDCRNMEKTCRIGHDGKLTRRSEYQWLFARLMQLRSWRPDKGKRSTSTTATSRQSTTAIKSMPSPTMPLTRRSQSSPLPYHFDPGPTPTGPNAACLEPNRCIILHADGSRAMLAMSWESHASTMRVMRCIYGVNHGHGGHRT